MIKASIGFHGNTSDALQLATAALTGCGLRIVVPGQDSMDMPGNLQENFSSFGCFAR